MAKIYHKSLFGRRKEKLEFLNKSSIKSIDWQELEPEKEYAFFVPKDFSLREQYGLGFKLDNLFKIYNSGIKTDRDNLFIDENSKALDSRLEKLLTGIYDIEFKKIYGIKNSGSYRLLDRIKKKTFNANHITKIQYRPFDRKWIYYDPEIVSRPGYEVSRLFLNNKNLGLITTRNHHNSFFSTFIITNLVSDIHSISDQSYIFPLYVFNTDGTKTPNFNPEIANKIYAIVGEVTPENILDYIYAVLYTPSYREKYKEFLKIDFPRVPYPENRESFLQLAEKGKELRELHLMESGEIENLMQTNFNVAGDNLVEKVSFDKTQDRENGRVYINSTQYFGNVSETAWNFYIGGYQPAQKWLKDRKGRNLSYEDIEHYRKIVAILDRTEGLMKELDVLSV